MENTFLRDLSILWTFIHCIILFMLLYESRYSKKKTTFLNIIMLIPLVLFNMLILLFAGIEMLAQLLIVTCVLPSFIFFFIMAKYRGTRFIFTFCLTDTITYWILTLTGMLDAALGMGNYIVALISRLIIYPVIELFIIKYLRKPYHEFQNRIKRGWGIFSILGALFYATLLVAAGYPTILTKRPDDYPLILLILILMPIMYITVFRILYVQLKQFELENEKHILNMQIKMARERILSGEENDNIIRTLRHDMKHKMLVLSGYIENGENDKAKEYINEISGEINQNTYFKYCDNSMMNIVLSHYHKIAAEKSIQFETKVTLPEKISISDTDLAVVISNALDNAIAAAEICEDKKITVKAFSEKYELYFEIKNTYCGNITFAGDIPKSNKEGHGFGAKSIAAIVNKYNGLYSFVAEKDFFVFRCMI